MNAWDRYTAYWNRKVRKLTIYDLKLVQAASMGFILVIVKLIPQIMNLSIWWFVALYVFCGLRPMYVFFCTRD